MLVQGYILVVKTQASPCEQLRNKTQRQKLLQDEYLEPFFFFFLFLQDM